MDTFQKVTTGDKLAIPAEFHNLTVDAVRDYLRKRQDLRLGEPTFDTAVQLRIKNVSGGALDEFAIVKLGTELIAPTGADTFHFGPLIYESASPLAASPFAVLQKPSPENRIVEAVMSGETLVRVDVHDAGHGYAIAVDGDYDKLTSTTTGTAARILWKESGTGVKWALVRLLDIGTAVLSSITSPLTTKGDIWVYDSADTRLPVGTNGQALFADSTQTPGLHWTSFAVGTAGTDFAISGPSAGTLTFNLPDASLTARGAVTTAAQSFLGVKSFAQSGSAVDFIVTDATLSGSSTQCGMKMVASSTEYGQINMSSSTHAVLIKANKSAGYSTAVLTAYSTGTLLITAADPSNVPLDACYGVMPASGVAAYGAYATVSGLVFKGGLYISGTLSGVGTVTSVDASGGTTGFTFTGGPITTSGTLTMSGTLVVANGGTGATSFTAYAVICGGTTSTGPLQNVSGVGTAGQLLTSNGASALPTWQGLVVGTTPISGGTTGRLLYDNGGVLGERVSPLNVAAGGTGVAAFDEYAVVCSGSTGTSDLLDVPPGTAGQVLTTNGAGSLPSWQSGTGGAVTPLFDDFADANNSSTSETDLYTHTISAGKLATNGDKITAEWEVEIASSINSKTVRAYFGGTQIFTYNTVSAASLGLQILVIRESSSVVRVTVTDNLSTGKVTYTRITGLTLSNTQVIKVTGQGGASNETTGKMGFVNYMMHA